VHAVTRKGCGYAPAENDVAEQMHSPAAFDPETGRPTGPTPVGWTSVFAEEMVALGHARRDVVTITAAMLGPTGLVPFAEAFPERCFDVGIAEQHALTSAAGLAAGGLHPVVAIYSTFLNRAFDQLLMDVALHRQAVTLVLDRAGVTGNDGPSHNGMWDLSILGVVPGIRVAAPRDAVTLREELAEAVAVDEGPTAVRFPKGAVIKSVPAVRRIGGVDVLREPPLHAVPDDVTGPSVTATASRSASRRVASSRGAARASPGTTERIDMSHMPLCEAPSSPVTPARSSTKVTGSRCSATSSNTWSKARFRKVAYTATTGCNPPEANPAAEVTACCSAMPTSKHRSGNRSRNGSRPVLSGIAAVMATTSGCVSAALIRASVKASV
jgi:hypothetical protein